MNQIGDFSYLQMITGDDRFRRLYTFPDLRIIKHTKLHQDGREAVFEKKTSKITYT